MTIGQEQYLTFNWICRDRKFGYEQNYELLAPTQASRVASAVAQVLENQMLGSSKCFWAKLLRQEREIFMPRWGSNLYKYVKFTLCELKGVIELKNVEEKLLCENRGSHFKV